METKEVTLKEAIIGFIVIFILFLISARLEYLSNL